MSKDNNITYCIEKLHHFKCNNCKKWWAIGDIIIDKNTILNCPHCGISGAPKQEEK